MGRTVKPLTERRIEYIDLDTLLTRRHPENPKAHDLPGLIESFERFGFVDPIIEDGRTRLIMAGHGRMEGLDEMRRAGAIPPIGVTPAWMVPVTVGWASKSDDEARALLIGLNQHTMGPGWEDRDLVALLTHLADVPGGFLGTGFDEMNAAALAMVSRPPDQFQTHDPSAEWVGMPGFEPPETADPTITVKFLDVATQEEFWRDVLQSAPVIHRKGDAVVVYWPPRPMDDVAALKFQER